MDQARQLAGHFLSLDMRDERATSRHRDLFGAPLLHLPPADNAGLTQMPCGVPGEKAQAYASAIENKQFENALPRLERSAAKAPYWLEGHYMVARCLEALPPRPMLAASKALAQLLGRFPELTDLQVQGRRNPLPRPESCRLEALQQGQPRASPRMPPPGRAPAAENGEEEGACKRPSPSASSEDFHAGLRHLGNAFRRQLNRSTILHGLLQAAPAWPRAKNPLPGACCKPCTDNWNNGICWIGNRNSPRGSSPCCLHCPDQAGRPGNRGNEPPSALAQPGRQSASAREATTINGGTHGQERIVRRTQGAHQRHLQTGYRRGDGRNRAAHEGHGDGRLY